MKKVMILALVLISFSALAQQPNRGEKKGKENKEMRMQRNDFTPEQQATLQTKKMTLNLDLSEAQQKEVYNLNIAQAKERLANKDASKKAKETGVKPTEQERYNRMIARLDNQILVKNKMKEILKSEQYATWVQTMENNKKGRQGSDDSGNKGPQQNRRG